MQFVTATLFRMVMQCLTGFEFACCFVIMTELQVVRGFESAIVILLPIGFVFAMVLMFVICSARMIDFEIALHFGIAM